jgi:hypothetical protein
LRPTAVAKDLLQAARHIQQNFHSDMRSAGRGLSKLNQRATLQACY